MKIYAVRELLTVAERSYDGQPAEGRLDVRVEVRVGGKPVELEIEDIAFMYPAGDTGKKPYLVLTTKAAEV